MGLCEPLEELILGQSESFRNRRCGDLTSKRTSSNEHSDGDRVDSSLSPKVAASRLPHKAKQFAAVLYRRCLGIEAAQSEGFINITYASICFTDTSCSHI